MNWKVLTKRNTLILLAIMTTALALGAVFYLKAKSEIVASVNGEKITKTELYELMVKQNGKDALDSLISERIIQLEAQKQNIAISRQDIQSELESYYEDYGGQEAFMQAIANSGYTLDDITKDIELSLMIRKLIEPRISISDDELKEYFDENQASLTQEKQVKASHILVDTEEKANEVYKLLANGEDFVQLAKEYSTDTATRDNGGELGFFSKGQMTSEFEDAAFSLKVGEISAPVKTEFGYHIIKVEEIKEAQAANYEQSRDKIYKAVFDQKVEIEFSTWLQEMYQQYKIDNFLTSQ